MRFSIASAFAVVLAAVSLAAAAAPGPSCPLPGFIDCVTTTQREYGGNQLADCVQDAINQAHFSVNNPETKWCLDEVAEIARSKGVPGQCNGCLCAAGYMFPGLSC